MVFLATCMYVYYKQINSSLRCVPNNRLLVIFQGTSEVSQSFHRLGLDNLFTLPPPLPQISEPIATLVATSPQQNWKLSRRA